MSNSTALTALICRRTLDLLTACGWPSQTGVIHTEPVRTPGRDQVTVCVRLDAGELIALLARLAPGADLSPAQRRTLDGAVNALAGTGAEMVLYCDPRAHAYALVPPAPGDSTVIVMPFWFEWLTGTEREVVTDVIHRSVRMVCLQAEAEARRLRAAMTPAPATPVPLRRTRNFTLYAQETAGVYWLDGDSQPEEIRRVLAAILDDNARYCAVRLTLVSEVWRMQLAHGDTLPVLRRPDEPARRWLDRDVVDDVMTLARTEIRSTLNAHRTFIRAR
ncbi:hypothetical protein PMPD1_4440 (plasmid) [Paramixta manurensis]|uniref:Uncharacterized protein n=1 Tax=Paramixta manurensis TaxID=2740817 RepID=A0A6M8UF31_9GAMM|nr:hypothetical protein PMPD1_4440 [Erwiniaceae bacterium PD-1]